MPTMDALTLAIEKAGGVGKLATALGLKQNVVSNWRQRGNVPANQCAAVALASGGEVTVHDLRPDVFGPPPAANEQKAA